jgi:chorismate mutase
VGAGARGGGGGAWGTSRPSPTAPSSQSGCAASPRCAPSADRLAPLFFPSAIQILFFVNDASWLTSEQVEVAREGRDGALLILALREANRAVYFNAEQRRAAVRQAKAQLDSFNLQLQNLLYERNHYLNEIQQCRDYKAKHQVEDLIVEEDFLQQATDTTSLAPHQVMLNRLTFELQERKRYAVGV